MSHETVVKKLESAIKKRRIITSVIFGISLLVLIVFSVLYSESRIVEEIDYVIFKDTKITYNYNYVWGIACGFIVFLTSLGLLADDFLFSKFHTVRVGKDNVTFYRGMLKTELYINGECRDGGVFNCYHLEGTLSDYSKVTVSVGKWNSYINFSNGYPSVEV